MGRQVNFYMTEDDEREFVKFVRADSPVRVFKSVQISSDISFCDDALPPYGTPFWFSLCLWNTNCLAPMLGYVPQQRHYTVEETESEIIQFHRSGIVNGRLVRGRIWAEIKYWDIKKYPPEIVTKSANFQKWYDKLARWIKRHSTRNAVGDYVMPGAQEFAARSGQLVQAVFEGGRVFPEAPREEDVRGLLPDDD